MEIINPLFSFYNPLRKILFLEQHHASPASLVFCLIAFMFSFSNTVLVSNILKQSAVLLKRHSFICSLLPSFNSFQFSLTRLLPNVHLPQVCLSQCAQGRTSMLPKEMLRSDRLCYPLSTCCLESFWTLPLARFLLPLIFSVSDYLCPDRLFLIESVLFFNPPHLSWHQELAHFTTESMELKWIFKFRDVIVDQFLFQHLFSSIPEN